VSEGIARTLPQNGEGPLYKQLANMILHEIEDGTFGSSCNLPTVRALAQETSLSAGTVKHAYDELERLGVIEKVRGRGTFVSAQDDLGYGKKDRAMQLMDNLLEEMRTLGFSLRETQIFFDLKMREQENVPRTARILVIDCNPEALLVISDQISKIRGAGVECRLLDDLTKIPSLVSDDYDIIVTTANHYEIVAQAVAREERVCRVVLSTSQSTVARLVKADDAVEVGIMTVSDRFARIIKAVCSELSPNEFIATRCLFGEESFGDFLKGLDVVIIPDYYSRLCKANELSAIRAFQDAGGVVIEFTYHIDAGSLMYLEQRIESVLASK